MDTGGNPAEEIVHKLAREGGIIACSSYVIKYTLIPLTLISEKLVTFHEHHNRKPFLNLIKIACGCYGAYLKIIGILKHVSF